MIYQMTSMIQISMNYCYTLIERTSIGLSRELLQNQTVCHCGDLHQYFLLIYGMYIMLQKKNTGRTNNISEGFNNKFKTLVRTQHPNI